MNCAGGASVGDVASGCCSGDVGLGDEEVTRVFEDDELRATGCVRERSACAVPPRVLHELWRIWVGCSCSSFLNFSRYDQEKASELL